MKLLNFNYILSNMDTEMTNEKIAYIICGAVLLIFLWLFPDAISYSIKNKKIEKAKKIINSLTIDDFVFEYKEKTKYISLSFSNIEKIRKLDGNIYTKCSFPYEYGYSLLIRKDNIEIEIEDELNELYKYIDGASQIEVKTHELCIYLNEAAIKNLKKIVLPTKTYLVNKYYLTQKYNIGRYYIPCVPYEKNNITEDDFTYENDKEYYVKKIKDIIKTELRRIEVYCL